MLNADYLRKQAETCLDWSRNCFDLATSRNLRLMAEEFQAKAAEIESRAILAPAHPDPPVQPNFNDRPSISADLSSAIQTRGDAS